jgi:ketosteroid isomerase-like protein
MKNSPCSFFIIILVGTLISCTQHLDVQQEKKMLLTTDSAFAKLSVEKGADSAFYHYLAKEAIQLPAGANPIFGEDKIFEGMKSPGAPYTLDWLPQNGLVSQSGDLGYTWGHYTFSQKDLLGDTVYSYGKYLNVWQKQADGSWKVLVDMGNKSPAPDK